MRKIFRVTKGFSLIEIIIAVIILALLTILVVVLLDPADFFPGARDTRRISDLQAIDSAVSMYRQDVGAFFKSPSISQSDPSNVVIGLVRQDCTGYSNCFTSLAAWQAARGGINFGACALGNLVCANKVAVARIEGAWSVADTNELLIDGWTTGPNNYIKIFASSSARHSGKWDDTKYRLQDNTGYASWTISIDTDYVRIDGLQVTISGGGSSCAICVSTTTSTSSSEIFISNNIIKTHSVIDQYNRGIGIRGGAANKIYNNIIYGFTGINNVGIELDNNYINNSAGVVVYNYNNTVSNSYYGIFKNAYNGRIYAKNNNVQNATYGYYSDSVWEAGTGYNISSDNTAPGANSKNSTIVSFISTSTPDYHLSPSDTAARGSGINLSADSNLAFNIDIDNDTRGGNCNLWDIGADQVGMAQTVFISLPDSSPSCSSYSLPTLSETGYGYRCMPISTFQKVDCTGWIPIDFIKIPGNTLSSLPIDPNNLSASGQYYTFVTDGKKWELTSILESDKNKGVNNIGGKDGGQNVNILEIGSNLTLTPLIVKNR